MSYVHAECARQILALLSIEGCSMSRTDLNGRVRYVGKNETNFGATLADLVQGGLLDENKIALRPTQYIRTAKQVPVPKAMKIELTARHVGKSEIFRQQIAAASAGSTMWPLRRPGKTGHRLNPVTTERRDRIMEKLRAAKYVDFNMEAVRDLGLHKDVKPSQMYMDMDALALQGRVAVVEGSIPKTWKIVTFLQPADKSAFALAAKGAPAAEAPAAVPAARAPGEPAARGRAADLADWSSMEVLLVDANNRSRDAKSVYIQSVTEAAVLRQLDGAIDSTEAALHIHRQRKPA